MAMACQSLFPRPHYPAKGEIWCSVLDGCYRVCQCATARAQHVLLSAQRVKHRLKERDLLR